MQGFNFSTTKTIINQSGGSQRLPELCQSFGAQRILVISDPGLVATGLLEPVVQQLASAKLTVARFTQVEADPSANTVLQAAAEALEFGAELVIGFGGGSPMDVAKLTAVLSHPQQQASLDSMYGIEQIKGPRLPLIQVPTTAGTGSEVTPIAIVTTGSTTKAGVVSAQLQPDLALLDAELTLGLPPATTAATGIDAMVHAIEAYTSVHRKNLLSDMMAKQALSLLAQHIRTAVHEGGNLAARQAMLLGACLAGQAFANAPVAAVHALAYPLGGHFHIPHGLSNSLVLPAVMAFNAPVAQGLYAELAPVIMNADASAMTASDEHRCQQLIDWFNTLITDLGLPNRLRDCNVSQDALPMLAADAMQQQRLLINNPRPVTEQDALKIYQTVY